MAARRYPGWKMSDAQVAQHWRWIGEITKRAKAKGATKDALDELRGDLYAVAGLVDAAGAPISGKEISRTDGFDRLKSAALAILQPADVDAQLAVAAQPHRRAVVGIEKLGLADAYLDAIARDQFGVGAWRQATPEQLRYLKMTAGKRAARKV